MRGPATAPGGSVAMKFRYEDLDIWKVALRLIGVVFEILKKYPAEEKFGLVSQGKRAVVSLALNISEGSGRKTNKDFSLFINRSLTSLQETDAVLKIGLALEYIRPDDYAAADPLLKEQYFKLIAFDKKLREDLNRIRGYSTSK